MLVKTELSSSGPASDTQRQRLQLSKWVHIILSEWSLQLVESYKVHAATLECDIIMLHEGKSVKKTYLLSVGAVRTPQITRDSRIR